MTSEWLVEEKPVALCIASGSHFIAVERVLKVRYIRNQCISLGICMHFPLKTFSNVKFKLILIVVCCVFIIPHTVGIFWVCSLVFFWQHWHSHCNLLSLQQTWCCSSIFQAHLKPLCGFSTSIYGIILANFFHGPHALNADSSLSGI